MRLIPFRRKIADKTDEELLKIFMQRHDPEIMGELFGRYMHLVYGVCLKYFKDPERAKDEVMALYEKVQDELKIREVKNFKSWLYVVTKNHCLMALRKSKPGEMILTGDENELAVFMENGQDLHPVDMEQTNGQEQALKVCMEKLKNEQRQCIRLFYYDNKCYREIAEKLDLDEKKVKSHIQNGKRNLKICLEKQK